MLNSTLHNIINALLNAEEDIFPLKKLSRKDTKARRKPWITGGIIKSIRHRHVLFREQLKKNDDALVKHYKKYRNKLNRTIENAKADYLKNVFEKIGTNTRKTWAELNKLLKKGKSYSDLPSELVVDKKKLPIQDLLLSSLMSIFQRKGLSWLPTFQMLQFHYQTLWGGKIQKASTLQILKKVKLKI